MSQIDEFMKEGREKVEGFTNRIIIEDMLLKACDYIEQLQKELHQELRLSPTKRLLCKNCTLPKKVEQLQKEVEELKK